MVYLAAGSTGTQHSCKTSTHLRCCLEGQSWAAARVLRKQVKTASARNAAMFVCEFHVLLGGVLLRSAVLLHTHAHMLVWVVSGAIRCYPNGHALDGHVVQLARRPPSHPHLHNLIRSALAPGTRSMSSQTWCSHRLLLPTATWRRKYHSRCRKGQPSKTSLGIFARPTPSQ